MPKSSFASVFVLALAAGAMVAGAQPQRAPRTGVGLIERKLALEQALQAALKNNLEIEIERTTVTGAQLALEAARGAFDGVFRWQPLVEARNTPTSSILFGAEGKLSENFHTQNVSYLQRLPWQGSSLHVDFENGRQSTNNPFVGLNPFVTSRLVLGIQQPLLRNRLVDRERTQIRLRARGIQISEAELELKVIDVVTRTEVAYWDLVAARQDVQVKYDGVDWAVEQLSRTRRMIEAGTLAAVELAASEAELERRRDTYFSALAALTEAENALKTLIAASRAEEIWNDAIVPIDGRDPVRPPDDDLGKTLSVALARRPELRHLSLRRANNGVEKELATDQLRPQLNVVASYASSGLAGTQSIAADNPFSRSNELSSQRINELSARAGLPPLPVVPFGQVSPGLAGGYGSALSGLFGGSYQSIQVGVQMDWNPRNRASEAAVSQAVVNERRLALEKDRIEQNIAAQVRNALQALETARHRITAAEASARAAREKLDSETRLFQAGESTNFFVLTRQNEYTDSLRRVVLSRLDLNRALARLRQAQGTTLEAHGIAWEKPR